VGFLKEQSMSKLRLGAILLLLTTCGLQAVDWPQWRGINRDGRSADKGLLKQWPADGPKQLWKNPDIGIGFSSPTIVGDTIYLSGDVGEKQFVFALSLEGKEKWKVEHGEGWTGNRSPGAMGSVVHDDGMLYLLSGGGLLRAYDAKTGKDVWQTHLANDHKGKPSGWGYSESPLIYKDMLIATPGGQNCLVALNKKTGEKIWASTGLKDEAGHASAIAVEVDKKPTIIHSVAGGMVGIDPADGKFLWRCKRAVGGAACATPIFADGFAFGATGYGNGGACVKLTVADGKVTAKQIWETKDMDCHHGGFIVHDGHIYGNHKNGWTCLELATGAKKWNDKGVGKGSICYADGMLYTFGENGRMGLVEATPTGFVSKGEFKIRAKTSTWANPVVNGGRLYLRVDSTLYCYDVKDATTASN
jgi:outer membrane protein assembly factor BamB